MLNEELVILNKIQKYLKESYQNIGDAMIVVVLTIWKNTSI
jgi:hypothetical protein